MRPVIHLLELSKLLHEAPFSTGLKTSTWFGLANKLSTSIRPNVPRKAENMSSPPSGDNIIWIDLEMTGLDPESCHILEAACLVTDKNINVIDEGPNLIIHQPIDILNSMNDWCMTHHSKTGLYKESLESRISLKEAEEELLKFVQKYTPPGKCPLAGNSVYMDKLFLLKYMPKFCDHLHYRILDVSSVKILAKNWYNLDPPNKVLRHRALDDIKESISELKFYQKSIFQPLHQAAARSSTSQ